MPERIQQLLNRVLEWWNKFNARQKTAIIAVTAGVVVSLAIVLTLLNRPQYVLLRQCESAKEGAEVNEILEGAGIVPRISSDGTRIEVEKSDESTANLLIGANNIQAAGYSIDNITSGGFSDTEADKQRRNKLYLETKLANDVIGMLEAVKVAKVELTLPENTGFLTDETEEPSAFIILTLDGEFNEEHAANLAKGIAGGLGSKTPENITIMDSMGNMLFSGEDTYNAGSATSQLGVKNKLEISVQNNVRRVILGTNQFDKIEVAPNIAIDYTKKTIVDHVYSVADGRDEGYIAHESRYQAESTNDVGGIPGTDSNGEAGNTTYQYADNAGSSSSESEESIDRLPNETVTSTEVLPGAIIPADSSVAATCIRHVMVREEDIEAQGLLDGTTWEAYKAANDERTEIIIDENMYNIVAMATGIPRGNIQMLAFSENVFYDAEGLDISFSDVAQIVLIIVILALLALVVIRTMRTGRETVQEEELSVESLLQSQPELELENISLDEGSEAKKLIDKFVDDNPEAAAALLRNWLNEDWA